MTTLGDRLHALSDELPVSLPPAVDVRRHAQQRRRTTAITAVTAGVVVALAAAAAVALVQRTDDDRSALLPAAPGPVVNVITDQIEQQALAGNYTPLAHPFLTEADWAGLTGGLQILWVDEPVRPLALLAPCDEAPSAADLQDSRSAQWRDPARRGRQVETVLTYTDVDAASAGVAALLEAFHRCTSHVGADEGGMNPPEWSDPYTLRGYDFLPGAVDDGFVIERNSGPTEADPWTSGVQLGVARDGNVVVAVESTGWGDRTNRTLEKALGRALGNQGGRCGVAQRDHFLVDCPEHD